MIYKLAALTASATGAQPSAKVDSPEGSVEGVVQTDISATATVLIQGRAGADAPWVTLYSSTASEAKIIALLEEMRVNVTANSGNVNVWLDVPTR